MKDKNILIVDDDLAFCGMLSEILKDEGANVVVENDGAAGINRALTDHPDLILFDVMMPRMSGLAALEQLRRDEWGKGVPVLLLTNVNQPETASIATQGDAPTEYLLKIDWTLDQIAEKVKKLIGSSE